MDIFFKSKLSRRITILILNKASYAQKRPLSLIKTRLLCSMEWRDACSGIGENYQPGLGMREAIEAQEAFAHTFQGLVKGHPFHGCQTPVHPVCRPRRGDFWTCSSELQAGNICLYHHLMEGGLLKHQRCFSVTTSSDDSRTQIPSWDSFMSTCWSQTESPRNNGGRCDAHSVL